jgi:outer membrane protein assembly factor BamA
MKVACVWLFILVVGASCAVGQPEVSNDKVEIIGNRLFSTSELESVASKCLAAYSASGHAAEPSRFQYCSARLKLFLYNRGYLQATVANQVTSASATTNRRVTFTVHEGALFRLGHLQLRGATLFSSNTLLDMFRLKPGDLVTSEALDNALYDRIETAYWNFGYIDYLAVIDPTFQLKVGANEGVVNLLITIDEGRPFAVGLVAFTGVDKERGGRLVERMLIKRGEIFSRERFRAGLEQINQTGEFEAIDADRDVDYRRDQKSSSVDIVVHLKTRGGSNPDR